MSTTTVTVSIGRNVNGQPMSDRQWDRFQVRTEAIVLSEADSFRSIHFQGEGLGWYEGESEESFTIVATIEASLLSELEARLAILAHVFGQEAIAVTAGATTIVPAGQEPSMTPSRVEPTYDRTYEYRADFDGHEFAGHVVASSIIEAATILQDKPSYGSLVDVRYLAEVKRTTC